MTTLPQTTLRADTTVHSLRAAVVCVGVGALCSAFLLFENSFVYLLFFGLLACLLLPIWISWSRKRLDYFEPVHVFGFVYFLYFGLGGLWTVQDPGHVAYDWSLVDHIPKAMFYGLLGHLAFLAGYYLPWRKLVPRRSRGVDTVSGGTLLLACGLCGVVAYGMQVTTAARLAVGGRLPALSTSLTQLRMFFLFGWALAWLLFFSGAITRFQRWILFAVMIPCAASVGYLTVSNKSLVMTLCLLPVVTMWYTRRRIPWKTLVAILLVSIFFVFPFYNTYRVVARKQTKEVRLERTLYKLEKMNFDDYISGSLTMFRTRLAMVNSLAALMRDVPRWEPYAAGETIFLPTLSLLVPRVIWPDKPTYRLNLDVGDRFRITGAMIKETHIALTTPGELYWNFSYPGIVVGMAFVGMALRFIYRRYGEGPDVDLVSRAIYVTLLVPIAYIGSSIATDVAEFARMIMVLEILRVLGRYYGLIQRTPQHEAGFARIDVPARV